MHKCLNMTFPQVVLLNIFCLFWTIKCFLFLKFKQKIFFAFFLFTQIAINFFFFFSFKEFSQRVRKLALS